MSYISTHARLRPGKLAVKDLAHGRQWTYAEFDNFVERCVSVLHEKGVISGDRVACLSKNRAEIVALHHACARIGAIFVPLNWRLSLAELRVLLNDCTPVVFFGDVCAENLDIPYCDINSVLEQCASVDPTRSEPPPEDLPSLILYTSGTTGKPKGVMLSERNITECAINFTLLGEVDCHSGFLCESPMFHIIGLISSVRPAFFCGGHIVISDGFIPDRTLSLLTNPELNISHYFCVPQMATALGAVANFEPTELRKLKAIFTGGGPNPEGHIKSWLDNGIAMVNGYGSTEAGTVFGMPLDKKIIAQKTGSVGVPTPRVSARVVDMAGTPVRPGETGELQLKGDNVTGGYWQQEASYQHALTKDGWFRTGDIATADDEGFYYIVDRKKDMYISGGENIYPAEIENLLIGFPNIKELAVIGVPDEKWGEVGCVCYVSDQISITVEDFIEFLEGNLAHYKMPRRACKIPELPRNGAGKVLKQELRNSVTKTRSASDKQA